MVLEWEAMAEMEWIKVMALLVEWEWVIITVAVMELLMAWAATVVAVEIVEDTMGKAVWVEEDGVGCIEG